MTKATLLALLIVCGTDTPAPSCQTAFDHFYGAGCVLTDSGGNAIPLAQEISNCQQVTTEISPGCVDEFDAYLTCLNGIASPATDPICKSCSDSQMALLACH